MSGVVVDGSFARVSSDVRLSERAVVCVPTSTTRAREEARQKLNTVADGMVSRLQLPLNQARANAGDGDTTEQVPKEN